MGEPTIPELLNEVGRQLQQKYGEEPIPVSDITAVVAARGGEERHVGPRARAA